MTQRLRRALEEQKKSTQQEALRFTGILGIALGGSRVVEVPTRNGYVYVRLRDNPNEVIQAFNNQVAPSYNLPVIVERQHNKYVVSGLDTERYENNWNSFSPYLPRHGNTHSFDIESGGGGDIVWVYPRQFMPALVFPSGSLGAPNVLIAPYILKNDNGTWRYTGNTGTQSFAPYRPTNPTGAVMGLVYLDTSDGNPYFIINSGTVFSNSITGSSQIVSYIPSLPNPATQIPLSAIRLITGTSQISWDNIYDVRQWIHNAPTGTGGGGSTTVQDEGVSQGSATTLNFVGDNVQATVSGGVARIFITGSSGGGINTGTLDARYLKLDASNDPITGELTVEVTDAPDVSGQALSVIANDPSVNRIAIDGESHGNYGLGLITYNFSTIDSSQSLTDGLVHTEPNTVISRFSESGTSTFTGPAIQINDEANLVNQYGGTLRHFISGTVELLRLNPQATGTVIPYVFNTQYPKSVDAILHSWQVQGAEKAYVNVSGTFYSNNVPLVKEAPVNGVTYGRKDAGWVSISGSSGGGGESLNGTFDGRLTLASGTSVPTTDLTAQAVIWLTPHTGNKISLYNGASWTVLTFESPSVSVPSITGTPFDIFAYNNGGVVALETTNWTNDTTRTTALTRQNGVLVKSGDATRRYLGTGRTTTIGGQVEDSRTKRFLWNYYNRIKKSLHYTIGTQSWTYATSTWRQANADASAKVEIVVGVLEDEVSLKLVTSCTSSANGVWGSAAVGEDSTTAPHTDCHNQGGGSAALGWFPFCSTLDTYPSSIGYHYYSWIERASAATITFYGGALTDWWRGGLNGSWFC